MLNIVDSFCSISAREINDLPFGFVAIADGFSPNSSFHVSSKPITLIITINNNRKTAVKRCHLRYQRVDFAKDLFLFFTKLNKLRI